VRIEWFGLAEAAVEDGRGALALVGLNLNVVVAQRLPVAFRRAVVLIITDDERTLTPGEEMAINFSIEDANGKVIEATGVRFGIGDQPNPEYPGSVQLAATIASDAKEYGALTIRAEATLPDGSTLTATKDLYVVPQATPA
jgi:hypothetical protein